MFFRQNYDNNGQWRKYQESEGNTGSPRSSTLMNNEHMRARNEHCAENVRIREKRSPSVGPTSSSNTGSLLRNKADKKRTSSTSSRIILCLFVMLGKGRKKEKTVSG